MTDEWVMKAGDRVFGLWAVCNYAEKLFLEEYLINESRCYKSIADYMVNFVAEFETAMGGGFVKFLADVGAIIDRIKVNNGNPLHIRILLYIKSAMGELPR